MTVTSPSSQIVDEIEGVQFEKRVNETEYEIPSIVYTITSARDESVTFTVRDPIPDAISVRDVGFRCDLGKEYWEITDGELVFEYTLDPGEEFTTVYAFRVNGTDGEEGLFRPPESVGVEPAAPTATTPLTRSSAHSPYSQSADDPQRETDRNEGFEERNETHTGIPETAAGDTAPTDDPLVDRLADEIESGDPSSDSLEILRNAVLDDVETGRTVDVRLEQVQNDVADLRAYTNALEEFLEENGSGREVIDSLETRMHSIEAELESVRNSTVRVENDVEAVESDVQKIERSAQSISRELETLGTEMDEMATDLDAVDERLPAYSIDDRFATVEDELESVDEFIDVLKTAFE